MNTNTSKPVLASRCSLLGVLTILLWETLLIAPSNVVYVSAFTQPQPKLGPQQSVRTSIQQRLEYHDTIGTTRTKSDRNSNLILHASSLSPSSSSRKKLSIRQLLYNFIKLFRKTFYPHTVQPTTTAASNEAPLPDGTLGCPFFGHNIMAGDESSGPGKFWRKMTLKLNNPGIFKCLFLGQPMTAVYGLDNMRNVLDREFKSAEKGGIMTGSFAGSDEAQEIFGSESLLRSVDKSEHSWLRKLVGKSMNPASVSNSIPQLVKGAEIALEEMLVEEGAGTMSTTGVVMEDVCTRYTLDVAWRQILGLNLSDEEIPVFHDAVKSWTFGIINPLTTVAPGFLVKKLKAYKARKYLDGLITSKIDELKQNGPDGSTLSAMVFATDDDDDDENEKYGSNTRRSKAERKMTTLQIMDNALLLILAGSETSASTLTTAMLFLGMYPDVYKKIQQEQQQLQMKYGNDHQLTRQMMDDEMPFLDAFIRETMRIKPLNSGAPRITKEAIVVDGKQIPKDWPIICNVLLTHDQDPVTIDTDGYDAHMDVYKGFKPDRWLEEETKPSQWMAFGYGPRYCLGVNLAMAEMKIFLSIVARNVEFSLVNGTDDIKWQKFSIIPKPQDGTLIHANRRTNSVIG
jgi:cytochrome P450 family 26 subfamily A